MIEVLLVDDSPADVRLTLEALSEAKIRNTVHVVYDGESALEFLRKPGQRRPDLILLDLNLPGLDGREVLAEIKGDPELAIIPVVILTTSRAEEDIVRTYRLHANCYVTKPVDLNQFIRVVQSIEDFWFQVVRLAPNEAKG
jgi:chemotaxis family two-component system response regulator Rcp1